MQPVEVTSRLHHLDALRAFAMVFGIFLHGRAFLAEPYQEAIVTVSGIFRMATFFIISGFFTAMVFARSATMKQRLTLILVPFFFFLVVFNPIAFYMLYDIAGAKPPASLLDVPADNASFPLKPSWHLHLWFLFALAAFTGACPALRWLLRRNKVRQLIDAFEHIPRSLAFLVLALGVAFASFTLQSVYSLTIENILGHTSLNFPLISIFRFFPYFALGVLLFHARALFSLFHQVFYGQAALVLLVTIYVCWRESELAAALGPAVYGRLWDIVWAIAAVYSANFLFWCSGRFFGHSSLLMRHFADSAYTVYLFHYYVLIGFYFVLFAPGMHSPLLFLAAAAACYGICFILHVFLVTRFRVTRLLVNGKTR